MKKSKLDTFSLVISIISILLIAVFPIIIWDALGNGAQHFMQYGNPGISGDSSGNSSVQFLFGTFYTSNFNVIKLFSGQWRVAMDIKSNTGTASSDALAIITFISVIGLIILCIYEIVLPIINKIFKDKINVDVIKKYGVIPCIVISVVALVFIGLPTLIMFTKVSKYGFRIQDFNAYGGIKGIIESIIAILLITINVIRLIKIIKLKNK